MRLKKGIKVEVLRKKHSWWPAEIISGNGHTYSVKYDAHQLGMAAVTERVPRKVIRPLPPSVDGMMYWSPGDIVELLEINSWKLAQVLRAAAGDCYFVKIFGSPKHIIAHESELRVCQVWIDNHWVIVQQDAARFKDGKVVRRSVVEEEEVNSPVPRPSQEVKNHQVEGQVPHKDHSGFEEGQRKRRRIYLSPIKLRTHDSLNRTELNDGRSVSSSVGSCSPCRSCCNPIACPTQEYGS